MKSFYHIILTTLMVLLFHGFAIGKEETYMDKLMMSEPNPKNRLVSGLTDGRLSVNAAYKMWVAKWQSFAFINIPASDVALQFTSDTKLFSGPSITTAYRFRDSEWFHSAGVNFTWLTASDWKFSDPTPATSSSFGANDRTDYSVTGSVAVWRGLGIFGGYYNSKQKFNTNTLVVGQVGTSTQKFRGPLIGLYGSGALNKWAGIYGNLGVAFLKFKFGGRTSSDVIGYSTEWGFNINGPDIWKVGTGVQIGYRAQMISTEDIRNTDTNDVTWGPIFSIVAKF